MRNTSLKPGQKAPKSGQYEVIGPRGGTPGIEVTVPKGTILPPPPTKIPGSTYRLIDPKKKQKRKVNNVVHQI